LSGATKSGRVFPVDATTEEYSKENEERFRRDLETFLVDLSSSMSVAFEETVGSLSLKRFLSLPPVGVHSYPSAVSSVASATELSLPGIEEFVEVTGTTSVTSIASASTMPGRRVVLKFAAALTFTDGSNLKLAGNFVTTADDTIGLVCDGTNWYEVSRSVN
jgi:hypothetical protein